MFLSDPLNLLLLAIAVVVIWRLRSVLGTRTGNERPPADVFRTRDPVQPAEQPGNVIRLPQAGEAAPAGGTEEERPPVWAGYAEKDSALAGALERMVESDPSFTPKSFVEGAKLAYEMIIDSFAKGDKASLKNLLSREVYDGFARAITDRESAGQRVEQRFVGIDKATILAAELDGSRANITVDFDSELISATYDKSGQLVDGSPRDIRRVNDVWTFERDVTSRNPNWKLVKTEALA